MNYLFGSRVRGNHRADSDADVSIQADIPQIASLTEQNISCLPILFSRSVYGTKHEQERFRGWRSDGT